MTRLTMVEIDIVKKREYTSPKEQCKTIAKETNRCALEGKKGNRKMHHIVGRSSPF